MDVQFDGKQTVDTWLDDNLVSAKHAGVIDSFMELFVAEIEKASNSATS